MKTTFGCSRILLVLLVCAVPMSANAIPIDAEETLRADFDLSGSTPAPPWDFLSATIVFDVTDPEDDSSPIPVIGFFDVFDFAGGPEIASSVMNVPGFDGGFRTETNVVALAASDLLDGIGVIQFNFGGEEVDVISVTVQGRNDPFGTADTLPVEAHLSVAGDTLSVPEPSTLALLGAGFGLLWFGRRRFQLP